MFRIKICGITSAADAQAADSAGADSIGFNFYRGSPRFIDPLQAAAVARSVSPEIIKVGVFVNAPLEEVCRAADTLGLDLIQLHGDEPPEYLSRLRGRPVMRAFRLGPDGWPRVADYLNQCARLSAMPRMVLVDAMLPGALGGTGQTTDWTLASEYHRLAFDPLLVLAGGLTPANVSQAIGSVRPHAVDTASGVESSPGRKDAGLVADFVAAARSAFATDSARWPK